MLEKLLVGMLTLSDVFSKTRNEILEEHRHRQRHVLVSFAMVMICIALSVMAAPSTAPAQGLVVELFKPTALAFEGAFLALGGMAFVWCCVSVVRLWRYESDIN